MVAHREKANADLATRDTRKANGTAITASMAFEGIDNSGRGAAASNNAQKGQYNERR